MISKEGFLLWNVKIKSVSEWKLSTGEIKLFFFSDRKVCVSLWPWALFDELSLGLFAPRKHSISPVFLPPTLTFRALSGTLCPQPLSASWLLGELLKGQTVPHYSAQMVSWSPQSAAQFLSPPVMPSKNRCRKEPERVEILFTSIFYCTRKIYFIKNLSRMVWKWTFFITGPVSSVPLCCGFWKDIHDTASHLCKHV